MRHANRAKIANAYFLIRMLDLIAIYDCLGKVDVNMLARAKEKKTGSRLPISQFTTPTRQVSELRLHHFNQTKKFPL